MTVSAGIVLLVLAFPAALALKPVTISKCCNHDEVLMSDFKCLRNESSTWELLVFTAREGLKKFSGKLPIHWKTVENHRPKCEKPVMLFNENKSSVPFFNGSLFSFHYNKLFHPDQFCLDYHFTMVCIDPQSISYPVVKKCCGDDAIFSQKNNTCIYFKGDTYKIDIGQDKTLGAGFPSCPDKRHQVVAELHESKILGNGSLSVNDKFLLPAGNFCLEHVLEHAGRSAKVISCPDYVQPHVMVEATRTETDLRFTIYPIGLALSVIFLVATLAAGSLLPASHHVLHWRCQTHHVACLMLGDVLLCITHLSGKIEYVPCFLIAVFMHFLYLSAFFWLNTMCFNIWWTFRDLRPQSTEKSQERIRLRLYEAYAWGIPFIITLIAASLDLSSNPDYEVLRPRFAENNCWFSGDVEKLTFFYGPIGTLLFINLLLFGLTARELTCGLWKRELVKSTSERAALGRVCIKLVVVMGISWIADLISFAVGGPRELWYVTDLINCLHGIFIFIVVGCQPQVLSAVKRVWCLRKHRQNGTAGTTNHHSSSSQGPPSMGDTLTNTNSVTNGTTKSVPLETSC
ncbi:probable G-protein coupled receptor Mth-like 1 [Anoplophora glabripennis]|uniref:probable G-protein coupled receptor Mth-like 1 n=1 Tax=Anoplophora glabripennis TaxID=217634 RepID=UPI000874EF06|nr:probable G-protein coupled receptor Mth-like 1 [Anoplophora glabripennis]